MKERFEGENRPNLIDALKRQEFVSGENALAEAMADQGQLLEFPKGHKIIVQGGEDNDIYLLVGDIFLVASEPCASPVLSWCSNSCERMEAL
jgi:CRP/FNR family transcriptional regulator, cyclic AMP receptor protein